MSNKKIDKTLDSNDDLKELLKEFDENPYDPHKKTPEDVMRIFFQNDIGILPVISRRNVLIGIIIKDDIVSEMSDLDRIKLTKIDDFITGLAKKMSLEDLLPFVSGKKDFEVVNIFGESQGQWSRLDLITACESGRLENSEKKEIKESKEEQVMEWIIYFILENIPRALYAMNLKGKTIFYNSYFEDILIKTFKDQDIDVEQVELSLTNSKENDFYFIGDNKDSMYFHNKKYDFYYEKVPMVSNGKKMGFLVYVDEKYRKMNDDFFIKLDLAKNLSDKLDYVEKYLIETSLSSNEFDLLKVAKDLSLTKNTLKSRINKLGIKLEKK